MLRSELCDYSDAYIFVKVTIDLLSAAAAAAAAAANENDRAGKK